MAFGLEMKRCCKINGDLIDLFFVFASLELNYKKGKMLGWCLWLGKSGQGKGKDKA